MERVKTSAAKRRRALAFAGVAFALLATGTYWLAAAGSAAFTISQPDGLGLDGTVADVLTMSTTITRSTGSAYKETGKTISRLKIAKDYTNRVRVSVVWTNPLDAAKVLNNPNAQIEMGLYRPVSLKNTFACRTANAIVITDPLALPSAISFCAVKDSAATGSASVSSSGELMITQQVLAGFLRPVATPPSSIVDCALDPAAPATAPADWCQPAVGLGLVTTHQRLLYLIASIAVPGGIPQGQQNLVGTLNFYVQAKPTANT